MVKLVFLHFYSPKMFIAANRTSRDLNLMLFNHSSVSNHYITLALNSCNDIQVSLKKKSKFFEEKDRLSLGSVTYCTHAKKKKNTRRNALTHLTSVALA